MARSCVTCAHPARGMIDALLADGRSALSLASEYGIAARPMQRHAANHAGRTPILRSVVTRTGEPTGDPLDELVEALRGQALAGNPAIVHQYRLALAAQADLRHAARPNSDLATEPEWIALRGRMLDALAPFPDARQAVADALVDR